MDSLLDRDYELIAEAQKIIRLNYDQLHYNHTVGAAIRCKNGRVYLGVNLYSLHGACAEQVAIGTAITNGERDFDAIVAVRGIKVLKPNQADHDRPYVYMTTMDVVAAFYLCNAVERPYYWFPYGFATGSDIPVYHELYPNALREVSEDVSGYIYIVLAEEKQVIP